jgi:hypothetical protein
MRIVIISNINCWKNETMRSPINEVCPNRPHTVRNCWSLNKYQTLSPQIRGAVHIVLFILFILYISPCLLVLPWKRCRAARVTSSQPRGEDSASSHRRAACILSRVVERTLPSSTLLRNPCRAPQQLADMSQYQFLLLQYPQVYLDVSWRMPSSGLWSRVDLV